MSKKSKNSKTIYFPPKPADKIEKEELITSFLDKMKEGREYESIVGFRNVNVDIVSEIKKSLSEIVAIRKRPVICYIANVINPEITHSISIDNSDQLPFMEMINAVQVDSKSIDIILVTPGGTAETVDFLVQKLRTRFDEISFILPYMSMSAGTIFCLSGDELIMTDDAFFGPIDPQVISKNGRYVPAQSLLTLLEDIQQRGEEQLKNGNQPNWTDIQILRNLDAKEIGNAINASKLSINLVTKYLESYKFKKWDYHKTHSADAVTPREKHIRAEEIANQLCNHALWLSHSSRIDRDMAWNTCKLKITHAEDITGLNSAIKRLWALFTVFMERSLVVKTFASENYLLFRNEVKK